MVAGELALPPRKHGGPGQPWLEQETAFLIDSYEERWYALKRGQLKAHQWEEVAAGVGARLGLLRAPKSGTQCRHKIEKLRQRYRAERQRSGPSRWPFFDRMERLERGPSPISVRPPPPMIEFEKRREEEVEDSEGEDDDEDEEEEDEEIEEKEPVSDPERGAMRDLASAVKRFRDGFVRMEMRRMDLMREMEREWIQMETKRCEMMLESQRQIFDSISRAVRSIKRQKPSPPS